jgi:hypothetical protein
MSINFDAINARLLVGYLERLREWLPHGKEKNGEYCVGGLNGEPGESLKININSGKWADFATEDRGGDPVSLYAAIHGLTQTEAARRLDNAPLHAPIRIARKKPDADDDFTPLTDPPKDLPLDRNCPPGTHHRYLTQDGRLLGVVVRQIRPEGKKSFCPRTPWKCGKTGEIVWKSKGFQEPRPLYGLDRLEKYSEAVVVFVEGEKCADALFNAYPGTPVLSWPGGAEAVAKVNFEQLRGRKVILWPDNDVPGNKAMKTVAEKLVGLGCAVKIVTPPADVPEKWDCADAIAEGWDLERLKALMGAAKPAEVTTLAEVKPNQQKTLARTTTQAARRAATIATSGQHTGGTGPKESVLYYLKQGGKFLWVQPSGQTVFASTDDVKRIYKNELNPYAGKAEVESFVYKMQTEQALDYAGSMPGYRKGVHRENGLLYYCMEEPVLLDAVPPTGSVYGEKSWPTINELMRRLFLQEDSDTQFWTVLAHLKMAHQVLKKALAPEKEGTKRSVQSGQAMALIGPKNCGKSFFLEHVIAPLLGGRMVDAFKAFTADSEGFNGELLRGEVWMIDDQEHSTEIRTRRKFAANLKSKLFGASMAFHAKCQTPITLKPFSRLFIFCNDTPENLSVLPPITEDISDKVHMIRCNKTEMPMPTGTEAERTAFRDTVAQELPHFAGWLESWTIPATITHQRTGVLSYIHPWVEAQLRKQSSEAQLVELILSAFDDETLHGKSWEGTARELKDLLTRDSAPCNRDARLLLSWPAATGTYLSRLATSRADYERDYGLRVMNLGQRKGVERYGLLRVSD